MLTRTFLHLPGVNAERERRFWDDGVLCWDELLSHRDLFDEGPPEPLEQAVALSRQKLVEGDARWFEGCLGAEQAWRLAPEFDDGRIAYLDIETDGTPAGVWANDEDARGGTTVVGVWDGRQARIFIRGCDLDQIPAYLARYKVLCTFNGRTFDLPYLEGRFGKDFFTGAHLDLRPLTRAVGLTGGLKKIEKLIGVERPASIRRYTGYNAVKLWRAYRAGRRDAMEWLARYNLADAVNLQAVLRATYNLAVAHERLPFPLLDGEDAGRTQAAVDRAVAHLQGQSR